MSPGGRVGPGGPGLACGVVRLWLLSWGFPFLYPWAWSQGERAVEPGLWLCLAFPPLSSPPPHQEGNKVY